MYISLWDNLGGHPENVSFMQFSQNIDGFRQNEFTRLLELIQLCKQNPLEKKNQFHYLPILYISFKDPGRSKYNHTSMESLVDVEYKYIRVNIVFPFHKLQDAERTSHCPPPPSYVTYLVRLAESANGVISCRSS